MPVIQQERPCCLLVIWASQRQREDGALGALLNIAPINDKNRFLIRIVREVADQQVIQANLKGNDRVHSASLRSLNSVSRSTGMAATRIEAALLVVGSSVFRQRACPTGTKDTSRPSEGA